MTGYLLRNVSSEPTVRDKNAHVSTRNTFLAYKIVLTRRGNSLSVSGERCAVLYIHATFGKLLAICKKPGLDYDSKDLACTLPD